LWIIRSDVYLMTKLSPISGSLVWGYLPHWVIAFVVVIALVSIAISATNSQRRPLPHAEKDEPVAAYKWWMIIGDSSTCSSSFR
jgi:hypothetical protein